MLSCVHELNFFFSFSVLDLYADAPPLETLMEVPLHVRRKRLLNVRPYYKLFHFLISLPLQKAVRVIYIKGPSIGRIPD